MRRFAAGALLVSLSLALPACSESASGDGADDGTSGDLGDSGDDDGTDGAPTVDGGATEPDAQPGSPFGPDPCEGQMPVCPARAGVAEGSGLTEIDRCAFPMADRSTWDSNGALVDGLAAVLDPVPLTDVLGDLNRTAVPRTAAQLPGSVPGVTSAFAWQSGDESVAYWIPQGITASGDGEGSGRVGDRRVLLVSWYYDQAADPGSTVEKGVRLAVVDATDPTAVRYRFLLLVEPTTSGTRPSFGPVPIHAGGLAWFGDYLYVVDTTRGLRVFDLTRILRVQTGVDRIGYDAASDSYYAHNYAYILPQIGTYAQTSTCSPRFSFVAVDRSTDPPSLVTGEYDAESVYGRLYRWPLEPSTGRLRQVGATGRVIADGVWFSSHSHVQGALAQGGIFWLSSSKPAGARGILYRAAAGRASADLGWSDTPEDLSYDPTDGLLWSLSEGLNARYVFSLPLTAVD